VSKNNTQSRSETKQRALTLLQMNRLAEAKSLFAELCRADQADAESYYLLGVINGKLGCFAEAADCFRKAVAIQPQMFMAHYGLGAALKVEGKPTEAAENFRQAVRIKPDLAAAHLDLGNVLYSLGKLDEAKESLQRGLRLKPTADAYFSLGKVQLSQGLMVEAIATYRAALKLEPARADIHSALGFAYLSFGQLDEAVASCQQAIKLQPGFPYAYNNLGRALMMLGRLDEAVSSLQDALRLKPDFTRAAACLVIAYEMGGNYQKAGNLLSPLIEQYPDDSAVAMSFARLCKHTDRCREAVDMMERVLQQENLSPMDKRELHFFAGKIYDSMNVYDAAFAHYQRANSIQAPPYDPAIHAHYVDALISTFSADLLRHLPRATHSTERPVFIVGMPRSGTSLVEQILASHPKVFGAGELTHIGNIVARMVNRLEARLGFPRCIHMLTQEVANTLAQEYSGYLDAMSPDAIRVTDKLPHNFLYLAVINLLFPGARVIHCMRDPLDTCLSIYFQYFNASHAYSFDLAHIGSHYREYERLMAHWRRTLDIPMLEVRYEDIVTNPDVIIPRLVEFCGLEWDPACLRFYENTRIVATLSYDQVRQPLHPKSIGRWKHYEKYLGPLKSALGIQD
jgi:tetratricopeptide (TPR) repeat protein